MTREEALEILTSPIVSGLRSGKRIISEAMNVAIKALQTEPCGDAISRQAVVEMVEGWWLGHTKEDDLATEIKKLPSVQPKAKTGKWLVYMDCEGKTRQCVCNQCGNKTGKYTWKNPNFCENCGAKMEGEE